MKAIFSIIAVVVFLLLGATHICARESSVAYDGAHLHFKYSINFYEKITKTGEEANVRFFDLKRSRGGVVDILTFCDNSLLVCAGGASQIRPYWFDADDGSLVLFHVTAAVTHRYTQDGEIYEAYPLCPTDASDGTIIPYGGECYIGLITNGRQTVSLTYWLGPNPIRSADRSTAIARARQILLSARESR